MLHILHTVPLLPGETLNTLSLKESFLKSHSSPHRVTLLALFQDRGVELQPV